MQALGPIPMASRIWCLDITTMEELLITLRILCTSEFWRMAVLWTLSLITSYLRLFAGALFGEKAKSFPRSKSHFFTSDSTQRPVCIITGATSGLGSAAAHALSKEGFFTVLEIMKENKNAQLHAFEADLSSFSSILDFISSFEQWLVDRDMHPSLQLLINNAGIFANSYRSTKDGLDEMMATNYVGAFCLSKLLLPLLKNSHVPARIVNVTSFTHRTVSDMRVNKEFVAGTFFSKLKPYSFAHIYEYSKISLLIFTYELHRQLSLNKEKCQVSVIAADPGAVKTNIMRELPSFLSKLAFVVLKQLKLLQSPEDGIQSILDAALAPPEISGVYFFGGKGRTIQSSPLSYDSMVAEILYRASRELFYELKLASKSSVRSAQNL
ncbi:hypothetical protein V2J09_017114 [Rumex salicifolius]